MATPVTGDLTAAPSFNTNAVSQPITVVTQSQLGDASDPVNQKHLSGKQAGAAFIDENFDIYIATGDATTDDWHLAGSDGTSDITPA